MYDLPQSIALKVRKIDAPATNSGHAEDVFTKLRNTWFGKFYRHNLKHYSFLRLLADKAWRNGYPIYAKCVNTYFSNSEAKQWRDITRLKQFVMDSGSPSYTLAGATVVDTPAPRVFPASDQDYLISPHDSYVFPEIFVTTINDAAIHGGTNLIQADGRVICHDLYDFQRDFTSEELHGRMLIDPKRNRIRWLLNDESPALIPEAATFIDACAPNYAHWMTEVLPRIALFCADERFRDVPVVVNDGLHKNIMESLFSVTGTEREIITLPIGRALIVNKLFMTSVAGYVPFERRNNKLSGHSHGLFSPRGFELVRNKITFSDETQVWPKKIFLRRNSGARKVTNAPELEGFITSYGFVIIEPEKLTYFEQAQLFSRAKIIIGSSGAALANILFVPSEAKIFIMIGKYSDSSYWYWQNIACASGKEVNYIFGKDSAEGIHADYTVDIQSFSSIVHGEAVL
jgi:capsular polysaccharide biosynthesis protein